MKNNYERYKLLLIGIIIHLIIEILLIVLINIKSIRTYKVFNGVVVKDNLLEIVVSKKEYELFKSNSYIYIKNKKYKFKIEEITRNIIKKNKMYYHSILIKYNGKSKGKVNDVISFSIFNKKIKLIKIFETIWKEDLDETT